MTWSFCSKKQKTPPLFFFVCSFCPRNSLLASAQVCLKRDPPEAMGDTAAKRFLQGRAERIQTNASFCHGMPLDAIGCHGMPLGAAGPRSSSQGVPGGPGKWLCHPEKKLFAKNKPVLGNVGLTGPGSRPFIILGLADLFWAAGTCGRTESCIIPDYLPRYPGT